MSASRALAISPRGAKPIIERRLTFQLLRAIASRKNPIAEKRGSSHYAARRVPTAHSEEVIKAGPTNHTGLNT